MFYQETQTNQENRFCGRSSCWTLFSWRLARMVVEIPILRR